MTELVWTPVLSRRVELRQLGSDRTTWRDTFEHEYHVPPLPRAPSTVLDLGANVGLTCAHYHALWPAADVVGYEMDLRSCQLARANAPHCRIVHAAVSAYDGLARYQRQGVRQEAYRLAGDDGDTQVRVVSLGDVIVKHFGGVVEFVKMDVEGEEWRLFSEWKGWAERVRWLLVELHETLEPRSPYATSDALVAEGTRALERAGFRVSRHDVHPTALFAER